MRSIDRPEHGDWIDAPVFTPDRLAEAERAEAKRALERLRMGNRTAEAIRDLSDQWDGWCGLP